MPADALTLTMVDSLGLEHPAIFGKLPAHGDFISRGIAGERRGAIDQWLSDWLAAGRAGCGDGFIAAYECAAPWLFEGGRATAVLMPSRDAVGRHFPLLIVSDPDRATQQVYDAMIDALVAGTDSDGLRMTLASLPVREPETERQPRWFLPEGADAVLPAPDSVETWRAVEGCFV